MNWLYIIQYNKTLKYEYTAPSNISLDYNFTRQFEYFFCQYNWLLLRGRE